MKVLHVIGDLQTGGAEKLLVDLLPILRESLAEVELVVFRQMNTAFEKALEEAGIRIHYLDRKNVYHPAHILKLRKIARQFDIVHVHNMPPQLYAAIAGIGLKTHWVTTEHTTTSHHRVWWFKPVERWMYSRYRHVICISAATESSFRAVAGQKVPATVIANGIDTLYYRDADPIDRTAIGSSPDKTIVTMVGRLSYQKDQTTLIRAIAKTDPKTELWLVGDGTERERLETLIHDLQLDDRVRMLGTRTDAANILAASDIVVQSSHIEGFGLAAVEGMAAGKPVIASRVEGLDGVVEGAGVLFTHQDADELADIITQLAHDRKYRQQVAEACQKRAAQFDIRRMAKAYWDVYQKIIMQ